MIQLQSDSQPGDQDRTSEDFSPTGHPASPKGPRDRIPLLQKLAFAIGVNTEGIAVQMMIGVLWMPFFNIGMGMSPVVLGGILMIYRVWDAITDPVVGNLSDNARTRWGRRKPFMTVGIIFAAVLYPLFWFMPDGPEPIKIAYLIAIGMLFFSATTCWMMPYYSMQLELTPNYDERTRLSFWMSISGKLQTLASGWILALVTSDLFMNSESGKPDIVAGVRSLCWAIAAVFLVSGLVPVIFVKERFGGNSAFHQNKESLWVSIKESCGCRPLWKLIGASFFLMLGSGSVMTLWQYSNIYYVYSGDIGAASVLAGWRTSVIVIFSIVTAPLWVWLAERFDKFLVLIAMFCLMIVGHSLNLLLMRPDYPYLQLVSGVAESLGMSGFWILLPSMKADVADLDELQTQKRREGSINAFYSWFLKLSSTIALGLGGLLLEISGFDAAAEKQTPESIAAMRDLYIFLPIVFWVVALIIALTYRYGRLQMIDTRRQLEARRGSI